MDNQRIVVFFAFKKTIKIMKLTVLMLAVCLSQVVAATYAQTIKLNVSAKNKTLEHVLKQIEKQSEFLFFYNLEEVNKDEKISIDKKDSNIKEILDVISSKTGLKYVIKDRHIVLSINNEQPVIDQKKNHIKGVVRDASGEPVIGANVVEKGTTNGSITDFEGKFNLEVQPQAILQITYIGYLPQEISLKGRVDVSVLLKEDLQALDEVVVVGYGSVKKQNLTGSVSSVNFDESMESRPSTNLSAALSGLSAGLVISQNSSAPGAESAT